MLNVAQGNQLAALPEEQPQHLLPKKKKEETQLHRHLQDYPLEISGMNAQLSSAKTTCACRCACEAVGLC